MEGKECKEKLRNEIGCIELFDVKNQMIMYLWVKDKEICPLVFTMERLITTALAPVAKARVVVQPPPPAFLFSSSQQVLP